MLRGNLRSNARRSDARIDRIGRSLALFAVSAAAVVSLAACRGGQGSGATSTAGAATAMPTATALATPKTPSGVWQTATAPVGTNLPHPKMTSVTVGEDVSGAFKQASDLAGFEVVPPSYLPAGEHIASIFLDAERPVLAFNNVTIGLQGTDGGLVLSETNSKFAIPPDFEPVPSVGATPIWSSTNSGGMEYIAFDATGRGYRVLKRAGTTVTDADALHVLESTLPAD